MENVLTHDNIIKRCQLAGLKMTEQRKIISKVLQESKDHPDVESVHSRALKLDSTISIATIYRTVKLFEELGIIEKLEFRDGKTRYEDAKRDHHDHLIDINSGEVIEFVDKEIEKLQEKIANKLNYKLLGHKLELYGIKKNKKD